MEENSLYWLFIVKSICSLLGFFELKKILILGGSFCLTLDGQSVCFPAKRSWESGSHGSKKGRVHLSFCSSLSWPAEWWFVVVRQWEQLVNTAGKHVFSLLVETLQEVWLSSWRRRRFNVSLPCLNFFPRFSSTVVKKRVKTIGKTRVCGQSIGHLWVLCEQLGSQRVAFNKSWPISVNKWQTGDLGKVMGVSTAPLPFWDVSGQLNSLIQLGLIKPELCLYGVMRKTTFCTVANLKFLFNRQKEHQRFPKSDAFWSKTSTKCWPNLW